MSDVSLRIKNLLPDFYEREGPTFVKFLETYYEWLDEKNEIDSLSDNFDIDTSLNEFISHFIHTYMLDIPTEIMGNVKLLQKHIKELYSSKGAKNSYKLLFALIFNDDVDVYNNFDKIFTLSDNDFDSPFYIEVEWGSALSSIENSIVMGSISGSSALVEQYMNFDVNGKTRHIIYVSNINGTLVPGDILLFGDFPPTASPRIIGSVVGMNIISSAPGFSLGDIAKNINQDFPTTVVVKSTKDGLGVLTFKIDKPGSYYSLNAQFNVDTGHKEDYLKDYKNVPLNGIYGFPKNPNSDKTSNMGDSLYHFEPDNILPPLLNAPTGADADISVMAIINTHMFLHNEDVLSENNILSKKLNETFPFPKKPDSDINSVIGDCLTYNSIEVGNISKIRVNNPGVNYSHFVYFVPIDPITSKSGILDANNEYVGKNGRIIGTPIFGDNIIDEVLILDSGFDNTGEQYLLRDDDPDYFVLGEPIYGGVGFSQGNFLNNKSFLSNENYFFDNYYYQKYAYVVKSSKKIQLYGEIVKKIIHPAGCLMFGDISISNSSDSSTTITVPDFKTI